MSNSLPMVNASQAFPIRGSIEYSYTGVGSKFAWECQIGANGEKLYYVNRYSWEGDVDWFEFMVSEAGEYIIQTQGNTDTYGALYQGSTLLAYHDDIQYPMNPNFKLQVTLSPNIVYRLRVSGAIYNISGKYYLTIEKTSNKLTTN